VRVADCVAREKKRYKKSSYGVALMLPKELIFFVA
jgi:hypothetical protein